MSVHDPRLDRFLNARSFNFTEGLSQIRISRRWKFGDVSGRESIPCGARSGTEAGAPPRLPSAPRALGGHTPARSQSVLVDDSPPLPRTTNLGTSTKSLEPLSLIYKTYVLPSKAAQGSVTLQLETTLPMECWPLRTHNVKLGNLYLCIHQSNRGRPLPPWGMVNVRVRVHSHLGLFFVLEECLLG